MPRFVTAAGVVVETTDEAARVVGWKPADPETAKPQQPAKRPRRKSQK